MSAGEELGGDPACWAHLFEDTADEAPPAWSIPVVVDLGVSDLDGASGAVWSLPHGGELDANLVRLHPGGAVAEHVNADVDVLMFVLSGSAELTIDGHGRSLGSHVLALIPRGARRAVDAGGQGVTYLSVHRRRDGLTITRAPRRAAFRAAASSRDESQVTE